MGHASEEATSPSKPYSFHLIFFLQKFLIKTAHIAFERNFRVSIFVFVFADRQYSMWTTVHALGRKLLPTEGGETTNFMKWNLSWKPMNPKTQYSSRRRDIQVVIFFA